MLLGCDQTSCQISSFTVTVAESGTEAGTVVFTVTDSCNILTTTRQVRMVLGKAINDWIEVNRSQLDTDGFDDLLGSCDGPDSCDCGWGFTLVDWFFGDKKAELPLGGSVNIAANYNTDDLTVQPPFANIP